MNQPYELHLPYPTKPTWGWLLANTYVLYRERFWVFFRIGLPIALLTYLFSPIRRMLFRHQWDIVRERHLITESAEFWILFTAVTFIIGGVYWILSTIFFAGIAGNLVGSEDEEPQIADAYSVVRKRLGLLLAIGTLTWIVFFVMRRILMFVEFKLSEHLHLVGNRSLSILIVTIPLLMAIGLLSRVGLAVPELMANPASSIMGSIHSSIRKTENWEFFFIFFVAKSAIVGYGVYWLVERGFHRLWRTTSISPSAYYWITWAVYVCLFALLESPLFIACCLLYRELNAKQDDLTTAVAIG